MQLEPLQSLALSVAAAQSPEAVLSHVVQGLGMSEGVALARVWIMRDQPGEAPYLELKASVGASIVDPSKRWNRTDGAHQKLPLTFGKVGLIATTNRPLLLQRGPRDWVLQPGWAEAEHIESFAGQPLTYGGKVLGVVAFFSRKRLEKADLKWLRVFADHAAVAIASARTLEEVRLLREAAELERDAHRAWGRTAELAELVAESAAMKLVLRQVESVAQVDTPVLILGESGVGKELVAALVHDASARRDRPFVKVNCASVPRELFESEFFGHVKGAFSGAVRDRQGRFLLADKGTLFLDEVGEIPLELQGKLLRVLQEQTFEAVGDDRTRRVNVRVIAATNRPLSRDVDEGRFRRDLYYRLSVLPIDVPPLRERREDIGPLAEHFLRAACARLGVPGRSLEPEERAALEHHDFPGNVRELANNIERRVVLGPSVAKRAAPHVPRERERDTLPVPPPEHDDEAPVLGAQDLRALERKNLLNALVKCGWQIAGERGAAKLLGLSPSTLSYRLKRLGIARPR
jgi:transcriptional regulator with GAF, ATPase, and Fis domain